MVERSELQNTFSIKDYLVFAPILGSTLAITFVLGSFAPIQGPAFTLFSLSEHILFSLQALPSALVLTFGLLVGIVLPRPPWIDVQETLPANDRVARLRVVRRRLTLASGVLIGFSTLFGWWFNALVLYTMAALFMIIGVALLLGKVKRPQLLAMGMGSVFCLAFSMGADYSRLIMRNPGKFNATVKIDGTETRVIVLRQGDRGVLYYHPEVSEFKFAKWEKISELTWPRRPIIHWNYD